MLVLPGARLSVTPPLLGARAERSPEGTRRQEDGPEMGRGHIGGVNNHVSGSCATILDSELHLNASLVHYEHFPQLTRTRIDEGHILARPAALAWCTGSAWRPRSATACLGAVWVPASA